MISEDYVIKAYRNIQVGEELFMDYNRSLLCGKCKMDTNFFLESGRKLQECYKCKSWIQAKKNCDNCNDFMLCLQCYDKTQV